jgi:hypothetical protein
MVVVATPGEFWEIEFFRDGQIEVERYKSDGTIHDESCLPELIDKRFDRKMRAYLPAHAGKEHERRFGWESFRVLIVTTDQFRMQSMKSALAKIHIPGSMGASLFFFATRGELGTADPLRHEWRDGRGKPIRLTA